jgi:eukaryotic-like serine/threonine-protein kinase
VKYATAVPLGAGASGEVLKAWDLRLERFVALKLLRSDDPVLVARMQREARLQAKLSHPNIADVYEVGELDGRPYIAMQLVDGLPLDRSLADEPLERRVRVMATIARAVHEAHEQGLVHRDLKPSNLLVERSEDGSLTPFVLDFGIAREASVAGQTETGQMIGTPGYLSPEQARGETTRLDRRSDVFALGVLLYEVLTGVRAFAAGSAVEALVLVLDADPPRPRTVAPTLPRDLETVILKCLEKNPDRRYGSARELADDLDRFLQGEPVAARPVGGFERLARRARRHPLASGLGATAVLALLVLGGTALEARRGAAARAEAAQRFGERAARMESWMRFAHLSPAHDLGRDVERVRGEIEGLRAEMATLGEPARPVGLYALGRGHLALDENERAVTLLEEAWREGHRTSDTALALGRAYATLFRRELEAISRTAEPELREARLADAHTRLRDPARRYLAAVREPEGTTSEYVRGLLAFLDGDRRGALAGATRAAGRPWFYEGWVLAGDVWATEAERSFWAPDLPAATRAIAAAEDAYDRAAAIARSDAGVHAARCAAATLRLDIALEDGAAPETALLEPARAACDQALVIDPRDARPLELLARAHWRLGQFQMRRGRDPLPLLDEAVRLAERGLAQRPGHADLAHQLGMAHQVAGTFAANSYGRETEPRLGAAIQALALATRARPDDGELWKALGDTYQRRANYLTNRDEDALPDLLAAADAYRRAVATPDFPAERLLSSRGNLATETAMAKLLRGEDASSELAEAIALLEHAREALPWRISADNNLGLAYWTRARWEEVRGGDPEPWYERAYALYEAVLASEPDRSSSRVPVVAARADHARHLLRRGEPVEELLAASERHLDQLPEVEAFDRAYYRADLHNLRARDALRRSASPAAALQLAEAAGREYQRLADGDAWGYVPLAESARIRAEWHAGLGNCGEARRAAAAGLELASRAVAVNSRMVLALVHRAALERSLAVCGTDGERSENLARARASLAAALAIQPVLLDPVREELGVPFAQPASGAPASGPGQPDQGQAL